MVTSRSKTILYFGWDGIIFSLSIQHRGTDPHLLARQMGTSIAMIEHHSPRQNKRIIFVALMIAMLTLAVGNVAVLAGPLEDAVASIDRKDYATALQLLLPLAKKGNAKAQLFVGGLYVEGKGVPRDSNEGMKWYRSAAEQGDAAAQVALGQMY
jgi:hypothetical protein